MATDREVFGGATTSLKEHQQRVTQRKSLLNATLKSCLSGKSRIVLEIGCGHGHWLTDFAAVNKEVPCVGIDLIGNRIERANRKASRVGLDNVHFLKAEANEFLDQLPVGLGIELVFILFPDPWPKKRHWKNRIMNTGFLDKLSDRCLEGARLHFRTDHRDYFDCAANAVAFAGKWNLLNDAPWPFERETVFQSKADSYQSLILEKRKI